ARHFHSLHGILLELQRIPPVPSPLLHFATPLLQSVTFLTVSFLGFSPSSIKTRVVTLLRMLAKPTPGSSDSNFVHREQGWV
ncbi:MAG TPA: hypothetical protein VKY85_10240, partial [Candidatus Angelobacter sp.]|nr:hypothetical protein [Candidatus Angelobacter sp.]